ncbi:MAG: recN [Ilumatobacteraceae bacterium]|nr:recN [Ilumatobacteraceae bacterium]
MLTELHIEDLGVIATLDLVFGAGLTALTGETGAGKTMLVEAINLLVGGRADATIVRPGAAEARIEGRFVVDAADRSGGGAAGPDGETEFVLARVVPVEGRSRAYVNGRLATVATLAEIGARLVDLHGQHAHQSLLGAGTQRAALDHFGSVDLAPLRAARARLTEIDASLAALGGDARSRAREIDLLRFQVAEIDSANLERDDEEDALTELEDLLAGAVAHRESAQTALTVIADDDGALDTIGAAIAALGTRTPFVQVADRLRSAAADLGDIASDLRDLAEGIDEDPQRLVEVRERRQMLRDLRRKYGDTLAEVIEFHAAISERLAELGSYDARAEALEHERTTALAAEAAAAAVVGRHRRRSAPQLASAVQSNLRELAMPNARVEVQVGDDPGDEVSFLLAANPGSPPLPLNRVASGGELARSMLALRLVLSEEPSTLVFDEVDAGVGGSAAVAIGDALAKLGAQHQVLVVTHLPQVAACASTQIVVTKHVHRNVTTATAEIVAGDERVDEVARMLSGMNASKSAREHAIELLARRQLPR